MPTVYTMPCTAVTIGLWQRPLSENASILPGLLSMFSAFGPKNLGMSRPAVKSLPSAHTTPTQYSSFRSSTVMASDICAIICGLNEFFFVVLSMMILNTRPCTSVRICPTWAFWSLISCPLRGSRRNPKYAAAATSRLIATNDSERKLPAVLLIGARHLTPTDQNLRHHKYAVPRRTDEDLVDANRFGHTCDEGDDATYILNAGQASQIFLA